MTKLLTDVLRDYRKGALIDQATDELNEITRAVTETGRSGKLVITLHVRPNKGESGQILMEGETKVTIPKPPLPTAIFYVDGDGGLHRQDPKQQQLFTDTAEKKETA